MAAGFGAYRRVLSTPEVRAFTAAGFAARLPMAMTGLGIVLLISITSGSYGRAGIVTAEMAYVAARESLGGRRTVRKSTEISPLVRHKVAAPRKADQMKQ